MCRAARPCGAAARAPAICSRSPAPWGMPAPGSRCCRDRLAKRDRHGRRPNSSAASSIRRRGWRSGWRRAASPARRWIFPMAWSGILPKLARASGARGAGRGRAACRCRTALQHAGARGAGARLGAGGRATITNCCRGAAATLPELAAAAAALGLAADADRRSCTPGDGVRFTLNGEQFSPTRQGYDHFR